MAKKPSSPKPPKTDKSTPKPLTGGGGGRDPK
jgi:hypothetical protein